MTALLFDEEAAEAAIKLSGPEITTETEAAALFARIFESRGAIETYPSHSWDWEPAQHAVRKFLPRIAKFDRLAATTRAALLQEFNRHLHAAGEFNLQVTPRGLALGVGGDTIHRAALLSLVPFLIPNGWPPKRIGRCQFSDCKRWFLRPDAKRGSVPLYCSKAHANLARVRAFRQRQEQES